MRRVVQSSLAALVACVAIGTMTPGRAHAFETSGLGLGADVALGSPTGLAATLGLGPLELDFILGASFGLPEGGVLQPDLDFAVGAFVNLVGTETTNFQVGGRFSMLLDVTHVNTGVDAYIYTDAGFALEADLRLEHALDPHFMLNFQAGIVATVWPDGDPGNARSDFGLGIGGTGFVGGAGFRFFFDPATGGPTAEEPPPARAQPAAQQPAQPAQQPAQQQQGESTPYWEQ